MRRRAIRLGAITAVAATIVCAAAFATVANDVTYHGHVYLSPRGRVALRLRVETRGGRPFALRKFASGEIPLVCDRGQATVRAQLPPHGALPFGPGGLFQDRVIAVDITENGSVAFKKTLDVHGKVLARFAHGGLSYHERLSSGRRCSTDGRLVWLAQPTSR